MGTFDRDHLRSLRQPETFGGPPAPPFFGCVGGILATLSASTLFMDLNPLTEYGKRWYGVLEVTAWTAPTSLLTLLAIRFSARTGQRAFVQWSSRRQTLFVVVSVVFWLSGLITLTIALGE